MGVRGILRDIVSVYLGIEIIRGYVTGKFFVANISVAGIVLFVIAIWFLLERIGVLSKV